MDHFDYRHGALHCENVPLEELAAAVGTPTYVYSRATLESHYGRLAEAFAPLQPLICYSIKSCGNLAVCRTLAACGAGMDIVSGGELHRARLAGVDPARCVYAGVGKTDVEIEEAIRAGVGWFNIESEAEFDAIEAIAAGLGQRCRAALRVNPDVDARTHEYTTTGRKENKFGVGVDRAVQFLRARTTGDWCTVDSIHVHLGSPIYSTEPYVESIGRVLAMIDELAEAGVVIGALNLGGGYGADYATGQSPPPAAYAKAIVPLLQDRVANGLKVILEPGRMISANAGVLLLRVLFVKHAVDKTFVICDGGMNVLIRPSYYKAFHFIWPARVTEAFVPPRRGPDLDMPGLQTVDVVGPICESGDFLATGRALPPVSRGDLLAVFSTGAYGMVMASRYNGTPLPAEVLVSGDHAQIVRRRETYDDLTAAERNPEPVRLPAEELRS